MTLRQKIDNWELSLAGLYLEGGLLWAASQRMEGSIGGARTQLQMRDCGIGTTPAEAVNDWIKKHALHPR